MGGVCIISNGLVQYCSAFCPRGIGFCQVFLGHNTPQHVGSSLIHARFSAFFSFGALSVLVHTGSIVKSFVEGRAPYNSSSFCLVCSSAPFNLFGYETLHPSSRAPTIQVDTDSNASEIEILLEADDINRNVLTADHGDYASSMDSTDEIPIQGLFDSDGAIDFRALIENQPTAAEFEEELPLITLEEYALQQCAPDSSKAAPPTCRPSPSGTTVIGPSSACQRYMVGGSLIADTYCLRRCQYASSNSIPLLWSDACSINPCRSH